MKKFIICIVSVCLLMLNFNITGCSCEHEWEVEYIVKESSCCEKGLAKYVCINCEETKEEELELKAHDYTILLSNTATCTSKGIAQFKCSMCDEIEERESLAKGHSYGSADVCKYCDAVKSGYDRFYFNGNVFDYASTYVWNNVTMGVAIESTSGSKSVELKLLLMASYNRSILWSITLINATTKNIEEVFIGTNVAGSMNIITKNGVLHDAYDSTNKYYIKVSISNF